LVVFEMSFTTVSYERNGRPRQLIEMKEKSRCSTLFHCVTRERRCNPARRVDAWNPYNSRGFFVGAIGFEPTTPTVSRPGGAFPRVPQRYGLKENANLAFTRTIQPLRADTMEVVLQVVLRAFEPEEHH
jgi:hypothetical protein